MKVSKQIYFTLELHEIEADKVMMLLEAIPSSDLPDWAKKTAERVEKELASAGVKL